MAETSIRASLFTTVPSLTPEDLKSIVLVEASRSFPLSLPPSSPHSLTRLDTGTDCAFLNFHTRPNAENAAGLISAAGGLEVDGKKAKIVWGRARVKKASTTAGAAAPAGAMAA